MHYKIYKEDLKTGLIFILGFLLVVLLFSSVFFIGVYSGSPGIETTVKYYPPAQHHFYKTESHKTIIEKQVPVEVKLNISEENCILINGKDVTNCLAKFRTEEK